MIDVINGLGPFDGGALALFDVMPEPVWLASPDFRVTYMNPAGARLLALPLERLEERLYDDGWQHLIHPDDRAAAFAAVAETVQHGAPYEFVCRVKSGDRYIWVRSRAEPIRDGDAVIGFIGQLIDVDAYRRAEEVARESEARLRALIDSDLIGFIRVTLTGRIVEVNRQLAASLGYEPAELAGRTIPDITPPEWHDEDVRLFTLLRETGAAGPFRKEYVHKNGSRVPILAVGVREPGADDVVVAYVIDLSAERQFELAFLEERRFNDVLLDSMPIVFWTADAEGRVTYISPWFYTYAGIAPSGDPLADGQSVLHPDDVSGSAERWRSVVANGRAEDRYVRYRRSDGSYRWHRVHHSPVRNERGEIASWFGFSIDVHEQRRASERQQFLLRATARLSPLLEPSELFERLVDTCVPEMSDSAQFFVLEDGELRLAAVAAVSAERAQRLREHASSFPHQPLYDALASGEALLYRNLDHDPTAFLSHPHEVALVKELGTRSAIVLPVRGDLGAFGAIVLGVSVSGRDYDMEDVRTVELLGQRLSVIIENAQRFAREHRVAEALQRASLPKSLPTPSGFALHAFYAAAASEAQIGGDWYDALELDDGRLIVSIGDVAGHGLEAAVTMGNVRQIIRGIGHVHPDPALMLEAADRALRTEHPGTYVTSLVCVIDPIEASLTFASAGHPSAILRKRDGSVVQLTAPGLPLGLRGSLESASSIAGVDDGDVLVLYTDGLTELHRDVLAGEAQLVQAIAGGRFLDAIDPAEALYKELASGAIRDDVALLVVEIQRLERASTYVHRFHADASNPVRTAMLRGEIMRIAQDYIENPEERFRFELVLGELLGNIVRHAPAPFEMVLEYRRNVVVLHALDEGEGFAFVPKLPADEYSERGRGLFLAARFADQFSVSRRPGGGSHARAVFSIAR